MDEQPAALYRTAVDHFPEVAAMLITQHTHRCFMGCSPFQRCLLALLTAAMGVQAAKSLGKTVRAFQPTIREIVTASTDIRSSLEESLGLDEIRQEWRNPSGPSYSQPRSLPPDLESPSRTATGMADLSTNLQLNASHSASRSKI